MVFPPRAEARQQSGAVADPCGPGRPELPVRLLLSAEREQELTRTPSFLQPDSDCGDIQTADGDIDGAVPSFLQPDSDCGDPRSAILLAHVQRGSARRR